MQQGHTVHSVTASDAARQLIGNVYETTTNNNYYPPQQRKSDEADSRQERHERLFEAVREGQRLRIAYIIEKLGADVDYEDSDGLTALHHAAATGYDDCVEQLIASGAYVNAKSRIYGTPLCIAACKGNVITRQITTCASSQCQCSGRLLGIRAPLCLLEQLSCVGRDSRSSP